VAIWEMRKRKWDVESRGDCVVREKRVLGERFI